MNLARGTRAKAVAKIAFATTATIAKTALLARPTSNYHLLAKAGLHLAHGIMAKLLSIPASCKSATGLTTPTVAINSATAAGYISQWSVKSIKTL